MNTVNFPIEFHNEVDDVKKIPTVSIFGAGVAGLSAAHEFAKLGYQVSVYETNSVAGGFFRSDRNKKNNMPTEYSWHGMGPWYHNTFDIMKEIPFDESSSVYDKALSHPIHFGLVPDKISNNLIKIGRLILLHHLECLSGIRSYCVGFCSRLGQRITAQLNIIQD